MLGLMSWVALGAIVAFVAPSFIPPQYRGWQLDYAVRGIGALIIAFGIFSTSYTHVGDGRFAQLFRVYGGGSLSGGKILAVDGENGPQARILRPGFQVSLLLNVLYNVDATKRETEIPDGKVGVLTAKDGAALRPGQAFADPFPKNLGYAMLDAETFLRSGGQRGPQLTVLTPGKYPLNDYLWKVEIKDAKDVATGFVGVVKSNIWADVDFGTLRADKPTSCELVAAKDKSEGRLEAPIVRVGCVGVWKESLQPGKYYFNPDAFTITEIDTRVQVWTYSGGYERCTISLEVDSKGEITQKRECRSVPVDKDNADRAVFVKMEGWDIPLELRALAQVSPEEASCVVAGVGTLKQVEDRVLTPSIRAITRDVAGGTYEVIEPKVDETNKPVLDDQGKPIIQKVNRPTKALDLINQRPLIEGEIERRIRPEAQKSCVTIREVRLGEPAIPPELLVAVRREQLATQLAKAYIQEKQAQDQRISSEKAKSTANQQDELVRAEIAVQRSVQLAIAAKNEGEGERNKLTLIADGQRAQLEVLGKDDTVALRKFELTLKTLAEFAGQNPRVIEAALTNAAKFVPTVSVGTSAGEGVGGMVSALFGQSLLNSAAAAPAAALPPRAPVPAASQR
jgi:SPFH domain / Band 7 family